MNNEHSTHMSWHAFRTKRRWEKSHERAACMGLFEELQGTSQIALTLWASENPSVEFLNFLLLVLNKIITI